MLSVAELAPLRLLQLLPDCSCQRKAVVVAPSGSETWFRLAVSEAPSAAVPATASVAVASSSTFATAAVVIDVSDSDVFWPSV